MSSSPVVAVFADIHGNLDALDAVLSDARQQGANAFWAAGDLTLGSAYPLQTLQRLREIGCKSIRGNSEVYVLNFKAGIFPALAQTSQQWASLRWFSRQVDAATLAELANLPEQNVVIEGKSHPVRMVHGSPRQLTEGLIPHDLPQVLAQYQAADLLPEHASTTFLNQVWDTVSEPVFICGHTHISWIQRRDGQLALNPGSLGAPINGDRRAQYALLHWDGTQWQAELHAVVYDLAQVRQAFQKQGLLEEGGAYARACLLNTETGLNVAWFFVCHVDRMARQWGVETREGFPDDVWQAAERTFNWVFYEDQR